jgi:hypothetical protein
VRRLGVVVLTGALLAACTEERSPFRSEGPTSIPSTTQVDGCQADDGDPRELEAHLVDVVPSGFTHQPDATLDAGPVDLAKAISHTGGEDADELLVELRFFRGYERVWADAVANQLIIFVYEFCDAAGARGYFDHTLEVFSSPASAQQAFGYAELPDAAAFVAENEGLRFVTLATTEGATWVQAVAVGAVSEAPREELAALAAALLRAQTERLR